MNILEIIDKTPWRIEYTNDLYYQKIIGNLKNYSSLIKSNANPIIKKQHELIDEFIETYSCTIDNYFASNLSKSYEIVGEFINKHKDNLFIYSLDHNENSFNIYNDTTKRLYKGRTQNWNQPMSKSDLFHIPYDKLQYIKNQRFSISGIPCVYLAQSIYACWEELGRPSFNDFFISKFQANKSLTILDLSVTWHNLRNIYDTHIEENNVPSDINLLYASQIKFKKYNSEKNIYTNHQIDGEILVKQTLLTQALKIACLSSVKEKLNFRVDYLFPNILLTSLISFNIVDGVCYPSTRVKLENYIGRNFAFPAPKRAVDDKYSSYLYKNLKLTYPINYSLLNEINKNHAGRFNLGNQIERTHSPVLISNSDFAIYRNTSFYNSELKIENKNDEPSSLFE